MLSTMSINFARFQTQYLTSAIAATVIVIGGAYVYTRSRRKNKIPEKWIELGKLEKIYMYPLKSGHRIELNSAECTDVGIRQCPKFDKTLPLMDRSFVVYSSKDNEFKTARTHPKLLHIHIETTDINYITMNAPNMRTLFVKIPNRGENEVRDIVQFSNEKVNAIDCGDEAGQWLSQYLLEKDEGMRLAYNDGQIRRNVEGHYKDIVNYYKGFGNDATGLHADIASMLLINQASVDDLNQRLSKDSQVTHNNFRANFLITGTNIKPYEEDTWDFLKIGDVIVRNVMECARCMMVTINQETGERYKSMEPLTTMKPYRVCKGPQKGPLMGSYLKLIRGGQVRAGDAIYLGVK